MQTPLRSLATLLLAVGLATCSDGPNAPVKQSGGGKGRISLAPKFSQDASAIYSQRSSIPGVDFDRVRVVLVRPPSDTVADTTIVFSPNSPPITLDLKVEVKAAGETFNGAIDYANNAGVVFHGETKVQSYPPDGAAPPQQEVVIQYAGIGATASRVVVTPNTASIPAQSSLTFTATVFDANNVALSNVPLVWSSSDPTVAAVTGSGTIQSSGKRGTVTITATTLTNKSGSASVTVVLPPAGIGLVSGGGQTGKAGSTLPTSAVVRVAAADGVGVAGAVVNFAAPIGGGVGAASVTTDANGLASTSLKLGGTAGPQSFAASAAGFSVSISATATAADPATIAIVSGDKQADSVKRTLGSPLVVKVTDAFNNPVPNVTVSWSRTGGSGSFGSATSVTNADGFASMSYTLGATTGAETMVASVSGVATGATFSAVAFAGAPGVITIVSGTSQTGRVGQTLSPFVVRVVDVDGNPVPNAVVTWSATNGTLAATTLTDTQGNASNTLALGNAVGSATVTASIANGKSVTFTATVQVGVVMKLAFRATPPPGAAGVALTPSVQVELQDAGGNLTAATNSVTVSLGANPGGATLTGTLTRAAVAGLATFDDLQFNKPGVGYTLVATSAGTTPIASSSFTVVPGAPVKLAIITQPSAAAQSGIAFTQQPSVQLLDVFDNPVPLSGVTVTAALATGTGAVNGAVSTTTNASGIATFTNLRINGTVGSFSVRFNSTGLTAATSGTIALSPGTPAVVAFTQQPAASTAGVAFTPVPAVAVRDADANVVNTATNPITVTIAAGTGATGATLSGTTTIAAVAGVVTRPPT